MKIPCENCIVISRCIAGILNIKQQWIDDKRIIDDYIDDAEVFDEFDSEVIEMLASRCELFEEYFPYFCPAYNQIQYPPDNVFKHGVSEDEWNRRSDEIQRIFVNKYYPLGLERNEGNKDR